MRSRALPVLSAIALILSACGAAPGSANPGDQPGRQSAPPASLPGTAGPTSAATATPGGARVVTLHGTFTGHYSGSLATADLTVEVEVRWNAGPDDIHDRNAFTLTSGSFEFSESIGGVCGGSRSEQGTLSSFVNEQALLSADPQERDNVLVSVIDQRRETGGVQFSMWGFYDVPNGDPEGCGDLDRSGVDTCGLVFLQTAIGELQREATCTGPGTEWTGELEPQPPDDV